VGAVAPPGTEIGALAQAISDLAKGRATGGHGAASTVDEYTSMTRSASGESNYGATVAHGGAALIHRVVETRKLHPEVVVGAHERIVREQLHVLPGESWSWRRWVDVQVLPPAGNFRTLRRAAVMIAAALDEGRSFSLERQHAYLVLSLGVLEAAAKDSGHDLGWYWPLLGTPDPDAAPRAHLAPTEAHALASFHREEASLLNARKTLGAGKAGGGTLGQDGSTAAPASPRALVKAEVERALHAKGHGKKGDGKDKEPKVPP